MGKQIGRRKTQGGPDGSFHPAHALFSPLLRRVSSSREAGQRLADTVALSPAPQVLQWHQLWGAIRQQGDSDPGVLGGVVDRVRQVGRGVAQIRSFGASRRSRPTIPRPGSATAATIFRSNSCKNRSMVCVPRRPGHRSRRLASRPRLFLPSASPELQPAERVWPLLDEPVANRAFPDLGTVEEMLVGRCRTMEADPQRLHAHTHFHWWPAAPPPTMQT